jgi:phosphate transport system permease protein
MTETLARPAYPLAVHHDEPPSPPLAVVHAVPRSLQARTFDDKVSLIGSAVGSLALVWMLYENVLPFSGGVGFLFAWYVAFVALYTGITALSNPRTVVVDRFVSSVIHAGATVTGFALLSAVVFTFWRGAPALAHLNFFHHDMAGVGPTSPLSQGGVLHAVVGTLIEISIAVAFAMPLGIGTAVYMTQVGGRLSIIVRTVVEAMTALPSIVAGLFIYTVVIVDLHYPRSGIAAALAIFVMILPIMARASDVVLRVVPGGLREASLALGASRWQTIWRVILPTARPGLATAVILAIARGVGETSPVLLTSGASTFFNANPLHEPMNSLPLFTYFAVRSGEPAYIQRGFGAASVLLGIVLIAFVSTRLLARRKATR